MKPLKILFLATNFKESATYFRAFHLSKQLAARGHDLTLMAVSRKSRFGTSLSTESGVRIVETPNFLHNTFLSGRLWLDSCGPLDIVTRIKEGISFQFNIIQTFDHFCNISIPFYLLRKRLPSKFVSDWCDLFHLSGGLRETYGYRLDFVYNKIAFLFRMYHRFVETDLRRKADAVTVISKKLKEIAGKKGIRDDRVFILEGGVDTDVIRPLQKAEARKKLGLPADAKIVVFMGRFQSDLGILLGSFARVKKEIPNSFLLVVGRHYEWTGRLAASLGIADRYLEVGRCSDELLPHYLACADVVALPLKKNLANEARWANKFGEYLASARPVVISNVGDQAAIVREFNVGLVADNNIEDFAKRIGILLENGNLSEELGQNARKTACEHYSWHKMAKKLEYIYYRTLNESQITNS